MPGLKRLRTPLILVLFVCGLLLRQIDAIAASPYFFDFNTRCRQAYKSMIALRISEANGLLKQEMREQPYNLVPVLLSNYDDCLTLLFNGDPAEYVRRKPNMDKRLALLKKADNNSPWYRYSLGLVYFQWAAVRIRFNEYFTAGTEFRKSFLYLKENRNQYPAFRNNQVLLGLEEAIVGTIPDSYRWITSMLGMKGDVKKGTAQIADFLNRRDSSTALMREEAIFYYAYLRFSLMMDRKETWKYLDESELDFRHNHLFTFMKANFALNDNKAALAEQTLKNRNMQAGYLDAPVFDYQLGIALLQKTDPACIESFQRFINRYKGRLFVKDALQKMSLIHVAQGDLQGAVKYKSKIKAAGNLQIDADKQAQRYAESAGFPNPILVKARLLCDGGYFTAAVDQLKMYKAADFREIADQLEYNYRYARIYTLMGKPMQAIPFYEATIKAGASRPEHFAARSALEMGQIYEDQGQTDQAIACYRKCLSMKNHDYKSSLDQKAKAGINRLGGK
jgi:tetratricopeptide (TPR) repeat protein